MTNTNTTSDRTAYIPSAEDLATVATALSAHLGTEVTVEATPAPIPAPTTGSALVSAVEAFWAALVARHPELPAKVVVVTGSGSVKGGLIRGHWAMGRWTADAERIPELFVSGERIADGPVGVATTVIHEAAHALLQARGDLTGGTSRQGRYHTKGGFAAAAEELGLIAPAKADPVLGFSDCTMAPATEELYAAEIADLGTALGTAHIRSITAEDLMAGAIAIGFIMGGFLVCVPWWLGDDPATLWGTLGGKVTKPRARRTYRRSVVLACECREVRLPAELAGELAEVACSRCGGALAAKAEEVAS